MTQAVRNDFMARIRTADTAPEIRVRRFLHSLGFRYRLHEKKLPGSPDIVLPKYRSVIFVHGCFWHSCPLCSKGSKRPKTNTEFWDKKLEQNKKRDGRNIEALIMERWIVYVVWECQTKSTESLSQALHGLLTRQFTDSPIASPREQVL